MSWGDRDPAGRGTEEVPRGTGRKSQEVKESLLQGEDDF